jgi:transposase
VIAFAILVAGSMYLRHTTRRKNGKTHVYWSLVRSVRRGSKVVQETVATLGELDAEGRAKARAIAEHFGGRRKEAGLFDDPAPVEAVRVHTDRIRLERSREFGGAWLGWTLWQALKYDRFLEDRLPRGQEDIPWSLMIAILVIARLCEPSSELHIAEAWYRHSALEDLLGVAVEKVNDDRLYRALDRLAPLKDDLEKHLRQRFGELFDLPYDLLLYDLTAVYFEGDQPENPLAARGHSPDKRPDCKQVVIALVVTREGMPLGYEIFAGNRAGVTTVEEIVTKMEERHGRADRIWVMDRGMVSEDNLEWLREEGRLYLVGTPKSGLRKFERQLAEKRNWSTVREGLEVKLCEGPDGKETFVLCRSRDRREKEKAMHERFSKRIVQRLESLGRRIGKARRPLDRGQVERQIGRILQQNSRAAGKFDIRVRSAPQCPAGISLTWREREEWSDWAELSEGAYILRTNIRDWSAEDLWYTYIQLTDAEAAFRVHKSDLAIRPIHHRKEMRVRAHIQVAFLAYTLWKTLEQWQSVAGLGHSPRKVIDEIKRIQSADVVLPIVDGREMRLRCVVRPDKSQGILLDHLGLELPKRLRVPRSVEM